MRILGKLAIGALCAAFSLAAQAATITSIAGGGFGGNYATRVPLFSPKAIAISAGGDMYVAESNSVRAIAPDGRTWVLAGGGTSGYNGDGIVATEALLNTPGGVAVDRAGNVYIADTYNHRIRKVGTDGIIRTVAGTGTAGPPGDGVATQSALNYPFGVAVGSDDLLYIADTMNDRIRRLNADGTLVTVAGGGVGGAPASGVPATQAVLAYPRSLAFDPAGTMYIADGNYALIRKVGADGIISTLAGGGSDVANTNALATRLVTPYGVAADARGNVFVLESDASQVRVIKDGTITRVAGAANTSGLGGDGGDALTASLYRPSGIATDRDGNVYIADTNNARVRKVALVNSGLPRVLGSKLLSYVGQMAEIASTMVKVGDVTGDGRADIVVGGIGSGGPAERFKVLVFARTPAGGLAAPIVSSYYDTDNGNASAMELADLNGDGILDILVAVRSGVSVILGNRNGAFVRNHYFLSSSNGYGGSLAVMDVNRDGKLDVVHQAYNINLPPPRDFHVFLGTGDGRLTSAYALNTTLRGGAKLLAADFNGDGNKDLVTLASNGNVYLFEHDGVGGFKPESQGNWGVGDINLGDFDNDRRVDMISVVGNHPYNTLQVGSSANGRGESIAVPTVSYTSAVGDLNGDGRDDLILNRGAHLAVYQQTDAGLSEEATYPNWGTGQVAIGDVYGDGCNDVVTVNGNFGGIAIFPGQGCIKRTATANDIDADGKSDLLWRDDARQHVAVWTMDGVNRVQGIGYTVPPEWRVLATGDFQGDRKLDVLWTDGTQMQLWEGVGDGSFRGLPMRNYPNGWRVVAVGDISGDGNTDLLWRDDANTTASLWVMKGAQIIDSAAYSTSPAWWVAGSGDLSGDGRLDVIWTDGAQMQLWRATENLRFVGDAMPAYPDGWELAAIGDVGGDGMADLMWRHPQLGDFAVWTMQGGARLSGRGYRPDPSWRVVQSGDFTGDGRTDVVWSNGSLMQMWQSQGEGFIGVEMQNYPTGWSTIRR